MANRKNLLINLQLKQKIITLRILKIDKVAKVSNACKIKDFIWDSPCNQREMALIDTPHAGLTKCLIYKEKQPFRTAYLEWQGQ